MEKLSDIKFLLTAEQQIYRTNANLAGEVRQYFIIKKGDEEREFSIKDYFELLLDSYYHKVDETKKLKDKILILTLAERTFVRQIQRYGLNEKDFSKIFRDLEVTTKALNTERLIKDSKYSFWRGFASATISTILSGLLVYYMTQPDQKTTPITKIEFPKDSIKLYLQNNTLILKDTSLVRLVKTKTK